MNINKRTFDNVSDAIIQDRALSLYYPNGRWIVFCDKDGNYRVQADECLIRDGVDESHIIYQARSNCNSGTYSWKESVNIAENEIDFLS
jgi:hypothetical protein